EHRLGEGAQANDFGAEIGEVLRVGRLKLAGRADLIGSISGHYLVNGGGVVEQPVGCVTHRANHRELVVHLGQAWQNFGEINAGNVCRDGFERAADVVGHVLFWIPQIEMAGAALKVNHDDVFGRAPPGATHRYGGFRGTGLQLEQGPEREAENSSAADTQEVATR